MPCNAIFVCQADPKNIMTWGMQYALTETITFSEAMLTLPPTSWTTENLLPVGETRCRDW